MGIILGRFRSKKTTYELLEKLDNQITSIQEFGRTTELTRKRTIGRFIIFAIALYLLSALIFYLYYDKIDQNQKLLYAAPLGIMPFVIFFIKKILTWYYSRKLRKNEKKLIKLRDEKKKILDNVMETETYKVAKKILDKFGNDSLKKPDINLQSTPISSPSALVPRRNNQADLRRRSTQSSAAISATPMQPRPSLPVLQVTPSMRPGTGGVERSFISPMTSMPLMATMGPVTPREILPGNRSILDKFADYVMGVGPSFRYALICKNCHRHNGMAFKEEFEYFSYYCCYCKHFNPARKQHLSNRRIDQSPGSMIASNSNISESSDSSEDSGTEVKKDVGKVSDAETLSDVEKRSDPGKLSDQKGTIDKERISDVEKLSDFDRLSEFDIKEQENGDILSNVDESTAVAEDLEENEHVGEGNTVEGKIEDSENKEKETDCSSTEPRIQL
ncbi:unnamed protein product [Acanthoscelides obtectus]|uniref:Endoplasmic reticulum junction formation protein lunapark n=1 Tax=Acanthoscelides obtectus TaxID=200917 RepID=A0A9P0KAJ8_ACAOB|nr:unnamed protein product [Acanthoscelides obtectus]CAK1672604.1 Endoplasmic reticulum junction formation protein lunapark [Acanthoscelides obtectus]